jgi:cytochrome bd-type quinol oxidase subunit 2
MSPASRQNLLLAAIVLILAGLILRGGSYALERAALELRYFWWLIVILGGGLWLLIRLGPGHK